MCAQQNRRAVLQSPNQCFTALDSTDEAGRWIDWRTTGRKKFGIHVNRRETAGQNAKKRAPFRVSVTDAHHVGTRLENTGMYRPFVRRSILSTEISAIEIEHDEPLQCSTPRADRRDGDKRLGSGYPYADVPESVRDALDRECGSRQPL